MHYSKFTQLLTLVFCLASLPIHAQVFNDESCNAHQLDVYNSCYNEYHGTFFVTRSAGQAAPSCGGYGSSISDSFGDVWFTATVPANGQLTISTEEGGDPDEGNVSDGAMTVYTGNCNSLTEIACNDNSNFLMPEISLNNPALAGATVWIRFWGANSFLGDQEGSFGICLTSASALSPPSTPAEPACAANPIAEDICANAPLLCNLNGYCGNTSAAYTPGPNSEPSSTNNNFCGTIENSSWLKFVANAETASLYVYPSNCSASMGGIQLRIYGTSDCINFIPKSNCVESTSQTYIFASDLTIGDTYYIYIDGNAGDNCDYTIAADEGINTIAASSVDASICSGSSTQLNVGLPDVGSFTYAWSPAASLSSSTVANPVASPTSNTNYTVTVTGACGATQTASVNVAVNNCSVSCPEIVQSNITASCMTPFASDLFISEYIEGSSSNKCIEIYNGTGAAVDLTAQDYEIRFFANGSNSPTGLIVNLNGVLPHGEVYVICDSNADPEFLAEADGTFVGGYNGNDALALFNNSTGSGVDIFGQIGCDMIWSDGGNTTQDVTLVRDPAVSGGITTNPTATCSTTSFTTLATEWESFPIDYVHSLGHHTYTGQASCCQICPEEQVCIEIEGSLLPVGGDIEFYASNIQGFNPYLDQSFLVASESVVNTNGPLEICFTLGETFCSSATVYVTGIINPHPDEGTPTTDEGTTCEIAFTQSTTPEYAFCLSCLDPTFTVNNNVNCNGGSDGSATVNIAGGTAPYSYTWDTGETDATATMLDAGNHSVTITDQGSCLKTASLIISEPLLPLSGTSSATPVSCNGGSNGTATASVDFAAGTTPYSYLWNNGTTNDIATGLIAGNYQVTITDNNGCTTTLGATVTEPTALALSLSLDQNVSCNGGNDGAATVLANGGSPAYSYLWDNLEINPTAVNLNQGIHSVIVTDANGCTASATVSISEPPLFSTSINVFTNASCFGGNDGTATAATSGGTGSYTYNWSNGASNQSITGLSQGSYGLTVSDNNGCTATADVSIVEPSQLTISISGDQSVSCTGGSDGGATATVNGGTPGYTYLWDNGETNASAVNLDQGIHTLTVTDANSCSLSAATFISEPLALMASINVNINVSCNGGNDGSATASASDGTGPYTFLWNNGINTATVSNLDAGNHIVTVTDSNNCSTTATINISEPSSLSLSFTGGGDVSCDGNSDGKATVNATGGTPGYTYLWDNGETNATATMLVQGDNFVTVTDANGCTETAFINIKSPLALGANATANNNVSCNGGSDGSATVNATGGTPVYSYLWDNGEINATASNLDQGVHTVTVTDVNGCVTQTSASISEPTPLSASITAINDVSCKGGSDGSAIAFGGGGTPNYTFLWSNGESQATAVSLTQGTHTVTITDMNGCQAVADISIVEPSAVGSVIIKDADVSCNGDSDGGATVTPNGGTPGYTYIWDNGETTATASSLDQGIHTITITDANGCAATNTITINEPTALSISISLDNDVNCNGGNDGAATVSVSGGTATYGYLWDNGEMTATASTLNQGNHSVVVTDANGCTVSSTINISEPTQLTATTNLDNNVSCNGGSDGAASVTVSGGTPIYSYLWDNGEINAAATNLAQGPHNVTVTDLNGCIIIVGINITEPPLLTANINVITDVSCNGGMDATATATGNGGTTAYTFLWSNGETQATVNNLDQGTHSVTVTDANGCTATTNVSIVEPTLITTTISKDGDISCNGGSDGAATVTPNGGTPGYTILWDNGETTASASNLDQGLHSLTVTDANGCTVTDAVTVSEPAAISLSISLDNDVSCNGVNDGSATVSASGGIPNYSFLWDNTETTATATNLDQGVHSVIVTDANACTATATIGINEPAALAVSISLDNDVNCKGGSDGAATVAVSGGTPVYSYLWDNGEINASATNLDQGNHSITITDLNGCSITAAINIAEPTPLTASISINNNVNCNGGTDGIATAIGNGGTTSYTFLWSNGETQATANNLNQGTHSVTITDANSCTATADISIVEPTSLITTVIKDADVSCNGGSNGAATVSPNGGTPGYAILWDNGETTASANNLNQGTHSLTVTDANGCTATNTININEPTAIALAISLANDVSCNGGNDGSATVSASGGTPTYTYLWDNMEITPTATNLDQGIHSVVVTDANACTATATININEPTPLTASISLVNNVSCNGGSDGSATVNASGGTPIYSYLWDNGEISTTATGLGQGNHSVTITDIQGCSTTASISIGEPAVLTINVSLDNNASCNGGNDGAATATANGGTTSYSYLWDNGENTASATNLDQGLHAVTVTDANGCTAIGSISISEPTALTATTSLTNDVSCNGGSDGASTVSANGGTPNYTYAWAAGSTTAGVMGLPAGTHSVTVTDANGCTVVTDITINEPANPVSASIDGQTPTNCTACNGTTDITTNGGTAPYTYLWDSGETTEDAQNLCSGTQNLTITDANSCATIFSVNITAISTLTIDTIFAEDASCPGFCDGSATVVPDAGQAPFSFIWDSNTGNQTTATATALCSGNYSVTVNDVNGCSIVTSILVTEPLPFSLNIVTTNPNCGGASTGTATANVGGATAPYTYLWDNGETNSSLTALAAGTYILTVTDDNSCTITGQTTLTEPDPLLVAATGDLLRCNGDTDGTVTLTLTGGTSNFSYIWTGPSGNFFTQNLSNVGVGTYSVIVTDALGCQATASASVSEPLAISSTVVAQVDNNCNGDCLGTATLSASGGMAPYTYLWPASAGNQTGTTATNLCAGTYAVTITDAKICTAIQNVSILAPSAISLNYSVSPTLCSDSSDGSATVSVGGGTSPYSYAWPNGSTTTTASGLSVGTYSITITDDNACSEEFPIIITSPTAISLSFSSQGTSCNGASNGTATVNATGGTGNYSYLWNTGSIAPTIVNMPAGAYAVIVTDDNGCTETGTVSIGQPSAVGATAVTSGVSCFGGNDGFAILSPTGGVAPYTYQWDNGAVSNPVTFLSGGLHQVIITDFTGCSTIISVMIDEPERITFDLVVTPPTCFGESDGVGAMSVSGGTAPYIIVWGTSPPQFGPVATGLESGVFNVSIVDDNGCQLGPFPVTVSPAPSLLAATITPGDPTCFDGDNGFATAIPNGGTPSYSYLWNDGQTTQTAFNLMAGTHSVTVTDQNGCTTLAATTLNQPSQIMTSIDTVGVLCGGDGSGSIIVNEGATFGGAPPYMYSLDGENFQLSPIFDGLDGGLYEVTVQDSEDCSISQTVIVDEPAVLVVDLGVDQIIQLGDSTTLEAQISTNEDVTYLWTPTEGLSCTDCASTSVRPVNDVSYQVIIQNANGCTAVDDINIFVEDDRNVFIPNAFSPNGDGVNDELMVYGGKGVTIVRTFVVYNRWGELVFEATDFPPNDNSFGWNSLFKGKKMNPGVYVYYAEVEFDDGVRLEYKGDATLIR